MKFLKFIVLIALVGCASDSLLTRERSPVPGQLIQSDFERFIEVNFAHTKYDAAKLQKTISIKDVKSPNFYGYFKCHVHDRKSAWLDESRKVVLVHLADGRAIQFTAFPAEFGMLGLGSGCFLATRRSDDGSKTA